MPHLQIRDCPDDVYKRLLMAARREGRSGAAQALFLLEKGVGEEKSDIERRRVLMKRLRSRPIPLSLRELDAAALTREDRDA